MVTKAIVSFEEDAKLVGELLQILTQEQNNLIVAKADEVSKLLENKSTLLQRMNVVAKKRYALLAEKSFEPNENGMKNWVKSQNNSHLQRDWEKFQQTIYQAKEMNRLNGVLINRHFTRNQQMLNVLQSAMTTHQTYGENGQTKTNLTSRGSLAV